MRYEKYEMKDGCVLTIPRPTCYKDCVRLIQSDYYRLHGRVEGLLTIWAKSMFGRNMKF